MPQTGKPIVRSFSLLIGALGVVYGDIGTSPLYALRECFSETHGLPVSTDNILGVLSLIVWSLILVVTVKYLLFVLQADNDGEGGTLALMALSQRSHPANPSHGLGLIVILGLIGVAFLYSDGIITPAISVLSAVEGLSIATDVFDPYIRPITIVILTGLFFIQRRGSGKIGSVFGPVMLIWFAMMGILGCISLVRSPQILLAANPLYGFAFLMQHAGVGFVVLGSVFLALTGAEALYADMGHFGKEPIRVSWFLVALPALLLQYFGQGALLLRDPAALANPFYHLAPDWMLFPLIGSGHDGHRDRVTSDALRRLLADATSRSARLSACPAHHPHVRRSTRPDVCRSCELDDVRRNRDAGPLVRLLQQSRGGLWNGRLRLHGHHDSSDVSGSSPSVVMACVLAVLVVGGFLAVDLIFLLANIRKIPHGGWFPLILSAGIFTVMSTWARGRAIVADHIRAQFPPLKQFLADIGSQVITRIPGQAVILTNYPEVTPPALLQNVKHNRILHEELFILTVVDRTGTVRARGTKDRGHPRPRPDLLHYRTMRLHGIAGHPAHLATALCDGS